MTDDSSVSIMDLFREEVRAHTATLSEGLLALEHAPSEPTRLELLMRAAHSLKGAARIVGLDLAVLLAHDMEDTFVAAQRGKSLLTPADIDVLLRGNDILAELSVISEETVTSWTTKHQDAVADLRGQIQEMSRHPRPKVLPTAVVEPAPSIPSEATVPAPGAVTTLVAAPRVDRPWETNANYSMTDLFREEVATHAATLVEGLHELAKDSAHETWLDTLQHAAHSIRSAARIVDMAPAAQLAQAVEEVWGTARVATGRLETNDLEIIRAAILALARLGIERKPEEDAAPFIHEEQVQALIASLHDVKKKLPTARPSAATALTTRPAAPPLPVAAPPKLEQAPTVSAVAADSGESSKPAAAATPQAEAVVRVTAQSLNRLMALAGESLVQARWLQPFATALLKLKKQQDYLTLLLDSVSHSLSSGRPEQTTRLVEETRLQAGQCQQVLAERIGEFEDHAARAEDLNSRLYDEVIVSRMRPFADGAQGFPRLVRDMARQLEKQVRLEVLGKETPVDRDILEKLEAPLTHLLRNAVDHGIEIPARRREAGKPETGVITLEARHRAGMLAITVADNGSGVDLDHLRRKIVERGLSTSDMVMAMGEAEVLEFLFLPGFSTAAAVTEFSGRGVGLDVVQDTVRRVGGLVRIATRPGLGTTFHLQLPITLSVLRAVLVDVAGEPFAFPHNRIDRLIRLSTDALRSLENRQFATVDGQNIGLVLASQLFDLPPSTPTVELSVVLLSDSSGTYGLIVDAFRGEQDLVVRSLDARLGKVPNVSAAAILDDGRPVLIADVEDLVRSMDRFIQSGTLRGHEQQEAMVVKKRVLVVDDSITVRETERQLLRMNGYDVTVGVDGQEGWSLFQADPFDLVVTDVDMPRMNGLDLVRALRKHEAGRRVPVIIISYKDREEDRLRGLEVGANYYLTKSSFHDNTFLQAVADLIGEA